MGFIIVLMLTTLAIAGSAAGFSVYGLAQVFAGAFTAVVIMGASLEAGKLVAASYVYRYWKDISFLMKTYLLSAIFVLMLITSAGIFGFLSAAYQTDTLDLRKVDSQIELLEQEKEELYERKRQIDADITRIGANYITKRMELIDKYSPETDRINARIPEVTAKIQDLKSTKIHEESHVGPIIYIAKVFNHETDDATKWMILLIIFAFDPLAVALTIATNNAMLKRQEEKLKKGEIKDIEEIQRIHDQAHEAYELGGMSRETLREFDELTDIEETPEEVFEEEVVDEPEPKVEDPEEIKKPEERVEEEPEEVKKPEPPAFVDHIVITPDMTEEQAHAAHSENTLRSLQKMAKEGKLSKEEHTLMRLLKHMTRNHMRIPNIKGGDDSYFITGEKK